MASRSTEFSQLNLPSIEQEMWLLGLIIRLFEKSVSLREGTPLAVFLRRVRATKYAWHSPRYQPYIERPGLPLQNHAGLSGKGRPDGMPVCPVNWAWRKNWVLPKKSCVRSL